MNSKKRLIVNADDFGIGKRITDAIIDCHVNGIVTSTTLMTNMPAAEYACMRARELPTLGIGVHLTITEGRPVTDPAQVPDLIDGDEKFWPVTVQCKKMWRGRKVGEQVEREYRAQIERALELGITPTHCDSHHGIHSMPVTFKAMVKVLQHFSIPRARSQQGYYWTAQNASVSVRFQRLYRNAQLLVRAAGHRRNHRLLHRRGIRTSDWKLRPSMLIPCPSDPRQRFLACLAAMPCGTSEVAFHPGYPDPDVIDSPNFAKVRQIDTSLARDPDIAAAIKKHGIELISYKDI